MPELASSVEPAGDEIASGERPAVYGPLARVRRFAGLYATLARDSLGGALPRVVMITAISLLGAFAQGATIGALSLFLRAIQSDTPWTVPIIGISIGADASSLMLLVVTVFALQVASAVAVYYAAISSRRLAREYHEATAARILDRLDRTPLIDAGALPRPTIEIRRAIVTYARIMGKATESLLGSIQVLCYGVGFLVILFMLSVQTTLIVLPIFVVVLPFLYRLGSSTQRTAKSFFDSTREAMTGSVARCVQRADASNLPVLSSGSGSGSGSGLARRYRDDPIVQEFYDSYDEVVLAANRSVLVTSLFRPLVLCLILLVLGSFALRESYSWDVILPYMLALWQFLNTVQHLAAQLALLYRFHPRVANYNRVAAAVDPPRAAENGPALRGAIDLASTRQLEGSAERLSIERGDRVLFVTPSRLSRIGLGAVIAPLMASSETPRRLWRRARFVRDIDAAPDTPVTALAAGGDETPEAVERRLRSTGIIDEVAALPDGPSTILDDEAWPTLGARARTTLLVLALAADPAEVVFLEAALLDELDAVDREGLLALLGKKVVFLVTANARADVPEADAFVVAAGEEVLGAGDATWWRSIRAERSRFRWATRVDDDNDAGEDDEDDL